MQSFDGVEFDGESLDPKARPLPEWMNAPGRKSKEKIWLWSHLTLYVKVSETFSFLGRPGMIE